MPGSKKLLFMFSIFTGLIPDLRVKNIEWREVGKSNLSARVQPAVLQDVSGLSQSQGIFSVDLVESEKKLLNTVPFLESVQLQKKLPSQLIVQYSVYNAKALGLRPGRSLKYSDQLWYISDNGKWITPVGSAPVLDLPLLIPASDSADVEDHLAWLSLLEKEMKNSILEIHEIRADVESKRLSMIVDLRYASRKSRVYLYAATRPDAESIDRLKQVVQYLIKNNILVSSIDLQMGKKVVVNVGIHP